MIYYVNEAAAGNEVWNVVPFKSVGKIKFGDSRDNVRKIFSKGYDCVPSPSKDINGDRFIDDGNRLFHVYYDKNDKVEEVGIYKGISVKYNGKTVFPKDNNSDVDLKGTGINVHSNMVGIDGPNRK